MPIERITAGFQNSLVANGGEVVLLTAPYVNSIVDAVNSGSSGGSAWFSTYTEATITDATPYDWDGSTYELRITTNGGGPIDAVINFTGTPASGTPYLFTLVAQGDPADTVSFTVQGAGDPWQMIGQASIYYGVFAYLTAVGAKVGVSALVYEDVPDYYTFQVDYYTVSAIEYRDGDTVYRADYYGQNKAILTIDTPPAVFVRAWQNVNIVSNGSGTPDQLLSCGGNDKQGVFKITFETQTDPADTILLDPVDQFFSTDGTIVSVTLANPGEYVFIEGKGDKWQLLSYNGSIDITPYSSGTYEAVGGEMLTFTNGILTGVA